MFKQIIFRFLKNQYSIYVLIFFLFAVIFFANILPSGYIISGTDHTFFLNIKSAFKTFFYTWTNGVGYGQGRGYELQAGIPFYFLQLVLSYLKLPNNILQTLIIPAFTFLSSVSFYYSLKIFFPRTQNKRINLIYSLVYGLNAYTLFLFMHVFGYFYQQVLYIFIPLLISFAYKILTLVNYKDKPKYLIIFIFISFIASMGFNNPGFFIATNVIFLIIFLLVLLLKVNESGRLQITKNYIAINIILLLTNAFWLIPYLPTVLDKANNITDSNAIWDMASWIRWQSTPLLEVFRLIPIDSKDKFPTNSNLSIFFKKIFIFLSFIYILLLSFGMSLKKVKSKLIIIFLSLLIFLILAISKVLGPLGNISINIFSLPLINSLRSYDKFMIFLPFIILVLIYYYIIDNEVLSIKIRYLLIIIILLYPFPFYIGKLQQNYSVTFSPKENYLNADYSFLVKVPKDYYEVSDYLNNISNYNFKIQYLPFDVINSPGWSQYPSWKFVGNDITATLFNKPIQRPSSYLNEQQFNYGKLFNSYENPEWILKFFGLMNDKYLIFHKDVDSKFLETTQGKIDILSKNSDLKLLFNYENIDLYEISDKYFLPYFYVPNQIINSSSTTFDKFPPLLSIKEFNNESVYIISDNKNTNKTFLNNLNLVKNEKGDIKITDIIFFDYKSLYLNSLDEKSQLSITNPPLNYQVNIRNNKLNFNKDNSKYININENNSYLEKYYKDFFIEIKENSGALVNNIYIGKSQSNISFIFDGKQPNINIQSNFSVVEKNIVNDPSFEKSLGNGANSCGGQAVKELPINIQALPNSDNTHGNRSLELSSINGNACTTLKLNRKIKPQSFYRFKFDYKNLKGSKSGFAIWQNEAKISFPEEVISVNDNQWHTYETIFKPEELTSNISLFFYSNSDGKDEVKNLYDNVILEEVSPKLQYKKTIYSDNKLIKLGSPKNIAVSFPKITQNNILTDPSFESNLGNGANNCGGGDSQKKSNMNIEPSLDKTNGTRAIKLISKNGNACTVVSTLSSKFNSNYFYKIKFDYKNLEGNKASYAVWQDGAEVSFPSENIITEDNNWHTYETIFKPEKSSKNISIFFYSNSDGNKDVINLYDNVELIPIGLAPESIISVKNETSSYSRPNYINFHKVNPTKFIIQAKDVTSSFPLVFSESFNKNWKVYIKKNGHIISPTGNRYISEKIKDVIQNDNIKNGNFWDTYFPSKNLYNVPEVNHILVNGYSNAWFIDTDIICKEKNLCTENNDGTTDLELIIEYWPQRWFYLGVYISIAFLTLCIGYLIHRRTAKRRELRKLKMVYEKSI